MRRTPPDFGCCATARGGTATAMATAKLKSLVFILSLPVTRVGSPDRPAVVLGWPHASRCGEAGQPGRRTKRMRPKCAPDGRNGRLFVAAACQDCGFRPNP